jgi:F1F0 ATPase subunit 2
MNESVNLILALLTGVLLGLIFFGGLWWTVKKGVSSSHPALWFFSSFMLRTGIVVVGFYLIGRGHWERMIVCFLGFIIARGIVTLCTRKYLEKDTPPAKRANHASQS